MPKLSSFYAYKVESISTFKCSLLKKYCALTDSRSLAKTLGTTSVVLLRMLD